jgi:large conductance mechanosensitive channel
VPTLPRQRSDLNKGEVVARKKGIVSEFKDFILEGDVLALAIAVVVGTAFGAVVKALVADLLTPLVAAIFGKPNFANLVFSIHHSQFLYGDFINVMITFLSVAAAVFFVVVKPVNVLAERRKRAPDPDSDSRPCPECLSQIPKAARRCSSCTSSVAPLV